MLQAGHVQDAKHYVPHCTNVLQHFYRASAKRLLSRSPKRISRRNWIWCIVWSCKMVSDDSIR